MAISIWKWEKLDMTMLSRNRIGLHMAAAACFAFAAILSNGHAFGQTKANIEVLSSEYSGEFNVAVNKSQILRLDVPFTDLLVGNSKIADVVPLTNRTIYVLGKQIGSTSLSIYGTSKRLIAVLDLMVTHDIETIKARLFEMLPGQTIEVRAIGDAVALSGTVSSSTYISRALAIAERHAPGKVTNLMAVQGSQQVMLAVRFAEVRRSTMKDIGFQNSFATSIGNLAFTLLTGIPAPAATFLTGLASYQSGKTTVNTLFDALEQKGVVKTLAEPTLIAMSGDTASFLAGGEFPIPVAQDSDSGGSTITIEFKQFGVSLAFTPTVLDNDLINLIVSPEVSAIDPAASITISGLQIPGLRTRRATTTVEPCNWARSASPLEDWEATDKPMEALG